MFFHHLNKGVCTFILALTSQFLLAQSVLSGKVSSEDGKAIAFASVKWKPGADAVVQIYAIANGQGQYELTLHSGLQGYLETSAIGYQTITTPIAGFAGSPAQFNITLVKQTTELKQVTVRNRPSVRITEDTTAYLADRFRRGNETNINDLLTNMPGFTVGRSGIITYNGKVIERVLVNGDDLTGKNYHSLTQHLDPTGIEEMQVIANYADPSNITSSLISGNEQVLNMVYKKGWLHRLFGVADAAAGLPATTYNAGLQAAGLFNKSKLVFIQRANNNGFTSMNPGNSNIPEELQIDPLYDISPPSHQSLNSIADINTGIQDVAALSENNTASSMLTFLAKPLKALSLRGRLDFSYDRYRQLMYSSMTYLTSSPPVNIVQQNDVRRKLQKLKGTLLLNYLWPGGKDQLLLLLKGSGEQNRSGSNNLISAGAHAEQLRENNRQSGLRLIYNHRFPNLASLSSQLSYLESRLPSTYRISPAAFDSFFKPAEPGSDLVQSSRQYHRNFAWQLSAAKKYGRHTLSLLVSTTATQEKLRNNISIVNRSSETIIGADSVNNLDNKLTILTSSLHDTWVLSSHTSVTIASRLMYYENRFSAVAGNRSSGKITGIRLLPAISLNHKTGRQAQWNLSYNQDNRFTETAVLGEGYTIRNLYTISRNVDRLAQSLSHSAILSFTSNDIVEKRRLFYSILSFSRMPLFYIPAVKANPDYTLVEYIPSARSTQLFMLRVSGQKLSRDFRRNVGPVISFMRGYNYRLENDHEIKTKFLQIQGSMGYDMEIRKVRFKTKLEYTIFYQTFVRRSFNQYWTSSIAADWKLTTNLFLDGRVNYFIAKPYQQQLTDLANIEAGVLFQTTNKTWSFGLRGTNLTGQRNYTIALFTPISTTVTSYEVFPRTLLASVRYRF